MFELRGTQPDFDSFLADRRRSARAGAAGETSITLQMDATGYGFLPGGYINISSQFLTAQTIGSNVSLGDSMLLSAGTWQRATTSTDAIHPRGIYCGDEIVYTLQKGSCP